MSDTNYSVKEIESIWREALVTGHRSKLSIFPGTPRCVGCHIPLGGVGGIALRLVGRSPSRKNPNICNYCDSILPRGGAEIDVVVLFADIRGSTTIGEQLGAKAFADLLNRFYHVASETLLANGAIIDKMIGDEVMAIFFPNMGNDYRLRAIQSAEDLMRGVGTDGTSQPWLPLGISVHSGLAYAGKVGTEGVNDFTVLGDTINTASRLQAEAKAGQIVVSEVLYPQIEKKYPHLERTARTLRGREEVINVRIIEPFMLSA